MAAAATASTAMTKEDLKNALVNHGIGLPPSGSKKEEYVALYQEHVSISRKQTKKNDVLGEFSSDDEPDEVGEMKKKSQNSKEPLTEDNSLIVDGFNIAEMSDDELFEKLKAFGVDVGPIVDSTRQIYRKKMAILLRGGDNDDSTVSSGTNGNHVNGINGGKGDSVDITVNEEYSADEEALVLEQEEGEEEEEDQPAVVVRKLPATSKKISSSERISSKGTISSPLKRESSFTALRQRITGAFENASPTKTDRFTPTPRRSIHSYKITESTKETMIKSRDGTVTRDFLYNKETSLGESRTQKLGVFAKFIRILPKIFLSLILLAVCYYVYKKYAK